MTIQVTDEMLDAFNNADFSGLGNADWEDSHIRVGLKAVLAIVERDLPDTRKLRDAFELACDSRNVWKKRAQEAGWKSVPK